MGLLQSSATRWPCTAVPHGLHIADCWLILSPADGYNITWPQQTGQDFIADHASPAIDFAAFHSWVRPCLLLVCSSSDPPLPLLLLLLLCLLLILAQSSLQAAICQSCLAASASPMSCLT